MLNNILLEIKFKTKSFLNEKQIEKLLDILSNYEINSHEVNKESNQSLKNKYLSSKKVEGCAIKTLKFYNNGLECLFKYIHKEIEDITTEDLREYLDNYQKRNNCSNVTVDNMRRILSSFFSWLEEENYILKSPMRRIHKIKTAKMVKEIYTEENIGI